MSPALRGVRRQLYRNNPTKLLTRSTRHAESWNNNLTCEFVGHAGLGRVCRCNLDKAQKYVLAAWQLSQGSDAADHLGQIYEKRGEKEQAIHFYALAMNARRPEPETRNRMAALTGE